MEDCNLAHAIYYNMLYDIACESKFLFIQVSLVNCSLRMVGFDWLLNEIWGRCRRIEFIPVKSDRTNYKREISIDVHTILSVFRNDKDDEM